MKPTRIRTLPDPYRERLTQRLRRRSAVTESGCVEWLGAVDHWGYGKIRISLDGQTWSTGAHRAAWLAFRGDIAGDLVVDHLCRNRLCINVAHLELVTNAVNGRRGETGKHGRRGRLGVLLPQACGKHGTEDGYLHVGRDGYSRWTCRPCRRAASAAYKARRRAA